MSKMKKLVEFDTAIGTSNLGDEIILRSLEDELEFLFERCFVMKWGTHTKNLPFIRYIFESQKIQFAYDADYKIIMGTNLLSRNLIRTQPQWVIGGMDTWLYQDSILAGVGTTYKKGKVSKYSEKIYKKILRRDFYHSVRDEESKEMLESMGFMAINTGCPTLWRLTKEFCEQIPVNKSDRVVFSLSGYMEQRDPNYDRKLLEILERNYNKLYFWCQTSWDENYLDSFKDMDFISDIPRVYSLKQYGDLLKEGNIDYVGTRLHGGIFALQNKVRTIVISIDHRARGFNETNNLTICERKDISDKLEDMINGEVVANIKLREKEILRWKEQFNGEMPPKRNKTHDRLLVIRLLRIPFNFLLNLRRK